MAKVKEKVTWGTYSMVFWKFYNSGDEKARLEFDSDKEALRAATSIYNRMSDKHIYDVLVKRRRNVLYLERTEGNVRRNQGPGWSGCLWI